MELIANGLNGVYPRNFIPTADEDIDHVFASIAYGSGEPEFLVNVVENGWRLDLWMRYDHSVPVAVPLLEKILAAHRHSVFCKLVPDVLHSKVIWWRGYGAYIGSANLSDRAWFSNIEAGLFMAEDELGASGLDLQLDTYFENLRALPQAFPLTKEVITNIKKIEQINRERLKIDKRARKARSVPIFGGIQEVRAAKDAKQRQKELFLREWNETLTILRELAEQVEQFRPNWINVDTPAAWQADQFLNAYYYNRVVEGRVHPYEKMHLANQGNPWLVTQEQLRWWSNLSEAPTSEDLTLNEKAPLIRRYLARDTIEDIGVDEFAEICYATHATTNHLRQVRLSSLGIFDEGPLSVEERIPIFANWVWNQRNEQGQSVKELLNWVLYGGSEYEISERLFLAGKDENYSFPRYGLSSLAEVVGWALPDVVPPRNGRTNKALFALGFDVAIVP